MKTSFIILTTAASTQALNIHKVYTTLRDLFRDDMSKCDIANMGSICTDIPNCPPCWIKSNGKYDCYAKANGQCPWPGMIDRQRPAFPAQNSDKLGQICLHGNQDGITCDTTKENCPPCWKNEGNGRFSCFAYVNGQCPWPGMIDRQRSSFPAQKSVYPAQSCLHGNQDGISCDTTKGSCPPCWKNEGNRRYSCFAYINGQCPWSGMIEIKN